MSNTEFTLTQKFVDDCCNSCNGACLDEELTVVGPLTPLPDFTTGQYEDVK